MTPSAIVSSRPKLGWARFYFAPLLLACLLPAVNVLADVDLTGDFYPYDSIFTATDFSESVDAALFGTVLGNEGIQEWLLFQYFGFETPPGPDSQFQHTFEEGDNNKVNIEIGRYGVGSMAMNGGSMLRYGHLIIGGSVDDIDVDDPDDFGPSTGVGTVTISGFGTVFNSNPAEDLIPAALRGLVDPTPRPESDEGYDVYVGLSGSGTLYVYDGGRMEIEDGLYVGQGPESNGYVLVSGVGSVIDQAGLSPTGSSGDDPDPNPMIVGALGSGAVRVEDGGLLRAGSGIGIGSLGIARLGDQDSDEDSPFEDEPRVAAATVEIDGTGSRIVASGGATVAIFYENMRDYENSVTSNSYLSISNSGSMDVNRIVDSDGDADDEADFIVGHSGVVTLDYGTINVSDRILNDGILGGTGQINGGAFRNRRVGTVRVREDELLRISALGDELQNDENGSYFMANDGEIDVLGGEIVFERIAVGVNDPFFNRIDVGTDQLPPRPAVIHGQDAVMRFRSGLVNAAQLAFTAGDNVLEGDVINELTGNIVLSGGANAVFEDNLDNLGDIELGPDGTNVSMTVLGDFTGFTGSTLSLGLGSGPNGIALSTVTVAGDITLGGELNVDLSSTGVAPLVPMPGDEFEIMSGTGLLNGVFSVLSLPTLIDPTWSWGLDYSNSDVTLVVLDIMTLGGDFNGDGIVDEADLAVWQQNFGILMGATGAQGDADGDGDVDADDYFIWYSQVGGAPSAPIASITTGQFVGQVPEPSTVCLMLAAVAGGWCLRRRRK